MQHYVIPKHLGDIWYDPRAAADVKALELKPVIQEPPGNTRGVDLHGSFRK